MKEDFHYVCTKGIIIVRVSSQPKNILLCQVYAPTTADLDEEIENFYEEVENAINMGRYSFTDERFECQDRKRETR